ncbi:acyltransferase family protein [Leifsonia sp. H3M29-4]|uniref:acyltransferase family protein n=1 Tax=Salinibacterium metalliresistens TaxID=3031321 RepID=UPI0023DBFA06|nr:acyltransferase family protein [Salinibacterium metalliresistens]MDF1478392.1 acyltransferase family protein [Salinibacterium metalliresistens]
MTSATTPSAPARLGGLDGLRAIAVLAVMAYHFLPSTLVGGYVGVDVFFVISGFLITGLLVREHAAHGRIGLRAFWARRARRLLPALALVVIVCSSVAAYVGGDVLVGLGRQVLGAATFSINWIFIAEGASYFDSSTPELFRNLWSLAVEEQFYLVWPLAMLLLLLVRRRAVRASIAGALAVASAVAMGLLAGDDGTRVYYGTDTHSFGLALGAALAFLLEARFTPAGDAPPRTQRIVLPLVGAAALAGVLAIAALLPEDAAFTTRGGLALASALTAIAILGATVPDSWLGRALDVQPLRWIGERSYGLYLWHWPVLVLLAASVPAVAGWWVVPVAALVVTVAAAAASYRFVETPVRRLGFTGSLRLIRARLRSGGRRVLAWSAVTLTAIALLAGVGLTGAAIALDPGTGEAQSEIDEGAARLALPGYAVAPRRPQPLPTGDQIYALGDSVMLSAVPELQEAFPGIAIDASVSRQLSDAEPLVAALAASGALRPILVIGLGTNGWIDAAALPRILELVGRDTQLIVVNVQAPRDWTPEVNAILAEFARSKRDVELSNWHDAIQPHLDVLAYDDIHMGPAGARIYTAALADALQRLAELPPLVHDNERGDAARPV